LASARAIKKQKNKKYNKSQKAKLQSSALPSKALGLLWHACYKTIVNSHSPGLITASKKKNEKHANFDNAP
jgi:hypothetical protein